MRVALAAAFFSALAFGAGFKVLPGQRIILKGDSITRGYGFGNYTDPSPLRTIPGIGSDSAERKSGAAARFERYPNIWQGLNADGTPKTVDTLSAELNANIKAGEPHGGRLASL